MSDDKTTIRIPDADFEEAKRKKEAAGQTWAEYLTDDARGTPDAEALADALAAKLPQEVGEDTVAIIGKRETVVDKIADSLEAANEGETEMSWEDVKNACAAAIREELTVTEMGGKR